MRKILSFSINISKPTTLVATPERRNIVNSFDYNGIMVGVSRLENEGNVELRERIWDASVNPSGPTYEGVVSGIARDLGFLRSEAFTIDLVLDGEGVPLADSPRVKMLSNRIVLYSDWRPDGTVVVDKEIETYKSGSDGFYIQDLVDEINTSSYFTATINPDLRGNSHSFCLVRSDSNFFVSTEAIKSDKRTQLSFKNISKGSIVFDDRRTFSTETLIAPSSSGEYLVDYTEGIITSFDLPRVQTGCSYHANSFPMKIESTPIQVFSLNDDDFVSELFDKETLDSGEEINSLPNNEGAEIYHQLYKTSNVFWGK